MNYKYILGGAYETEQQLAQITYMYFSLDKAARLQSVTFNFIAISTTFALKSVELLFGVQCFRDVR